MAFHVYSLLHVCFEFCKLIKVFFIKKTYISNRRKINLNNIFSIFADKYLDLAKLCIAKGKEETALKCIEKAHQARTNAENRIKPEDLKAPVYIISPQIKPEDLGYEKGNLHKIAT